MQCFLLGVHNLSQALIESRVIYNSASPLPEWAAPSYCSPVRAFPHFCPSILTEGHTQVPKMEKKGPFLLATSSSLHSCTFSGARLSVLRVLPQPTHQQQTQHCSSASKRLVTAFSNLPCLETDRTWTEHLMCLLSLPARKLNLDMRKGLSQCVRAGGWVLAQQGLGEPGFWVVGRRGGHWES